MRTKLTAHVHTAGALLATVLFAAAPAAATDVSGGIFSDTTWSLPGSPYVVTGNVVVFPGVTLTVAPGVQVRFADKQGLQVRGRLLAEGSSAQRIRFAGLTPTIVSGSWPGIEVLTDLGATASFKFVTIAHALTALALDDTGADAITFEDSELRVNWSGITGGEGIAVTRSRFISNGAAIFSGPAVNSPGAIITQCEFVGNRVGAQSAALVTSSTFTANRQGLLSAGTVSDCIFSSNELGAQAQIVDDSTFTNNVNGVSGAQAVRRSIFRGGQTAMFAVRTVEECDVRNALFGLQGPSTLAVRYSTFSGLQRAIADVGNGTVIEYNRIAYNDRGVVLTGVPQIKFNNIVGHSVYGIENTIIANQDATDNWWSASGAFIDATIFDAFDDVSVGIVQYGPVASGPFDILPPSTSTTTSSSTLPTTTTTSTTIADSTQAYVPTDVARWRCEQTVAKQAAKLFTSIVNCHRNAAKEGLEGRPSSRAACEAKARLKFDIAASRADDCPPCLGTPEQSGIRDLVTEVLVGNIGRFYCEGTTPLP